MLDELQITDFAIMDRLTVRFEQGFNVLTGETGAGKSILIDAVSAVLGGRTSSEVVRTGSKTARVEAVFSLEDVEAVATVGRILAGYELQDEEPVLILAREIGVNGRSMARVNGRIVPASLLSELGSVLVDIHGQGDHLSLLKVSGHVELLDRYGGTLERRMVVAALVGELRAIQAEEERLRTVRRDAARRLDVLQYQVAEIEQARLRAGEEEDLEAERAVLANADRLTGLAQSALALLSDGGGDEVNARDLVDRAVHTLGELVRIDAAQAALLESLHAALYTVEEVAHDLAHYAAAIDADPLRLSALEERLLLLQQLKRKYGETIAEVIAFGEHAAAEMDELVQADDRLETLAVEAEQLRARIGREAAALSAARRVAAGDLGRRVEEQLADLNMQRARFSVAMQRREDPQGVPVPGEPARYTCDETGLDHVEFLISPNPGEALRPLARIASGGETARLMLALKTILSQADRTPTLIFDEVDTGVGGRSGGVVGEKLRMLGRSHQVICITHLPQVAAMGAYHLRIEKQLVADRTRTVISALDPPERVDEIASMIGGIPVTEQARQTARELLARGQYLAGTPA